MERYKEKFINFLLDNGALKFGEFTLKSGRISPYFLNTGMLHSGEALNMLGSIYAEAIFGSIGSNFTTIFGPAYKGIPLAVATITALHTKYGINRNYSFNRKEVKDHA